MQEKERFKATFGAGCFWCVEAIFQDLKGVTEVTSGYTGGHINNPSYQDICTGQSGHAEVIQITYNPDEISYAFLVEVFFTTHDPTTLNRQGADKGTQYRSSIFYHDEEQKRIATDLKDNFATSIWNKPITTEISPLKKFYSAEAYHQNYLNNNPNQPYCLFVINPKVKKFRKAYAHKLKDHVK